MFKCLSVCAWVVCARVAYGGGVGGNNNDGRCSSYYYPNFV